MTRTNLATKLAGSYLAMSCEGLELWAGVDDVLEFNTASVQAVLVGVHFPPQPPGSFGIGLREELLQRHSVKETQTLYSM